MKQSGYLNPNEETGTECPVTSKYGRTPPNKHGGVGRQQQQQRIPLDMTFDRGAKFSSEISNNVAYLLGVQLHRTTFNR